MLKILSFAVILASALVALEGRNECAGKLGKDTVYCVCNTTYCDDIPVLTKQVKLKNKFCVTYVKISGNLQTAEGYCYGVRDEQKWSPIQESKLQFGKSSASGDVIELTIDKNQRFQKMLGLGAAFTDSATINIDSLPKELAEHAVRDYYGGNGIEFSIGRVTIASSDFSPRWYSYDDVNHTDYELKDWKLQDEDIKHKIPNIKLAQSVSPHKLKLFGSPWVTPKWLNNKTDIKINPDPHYHTWANYMIKFLDAYKQHGIDFWGLTMQNEPMSFDNMNFTESTVERDFVAKHLGPALDKAGYTRDKFNLMLFDEGHPKSHPFEYVDTVLSDANAHKHVNGIAYHCYLGSNMTWINQVKAKYPEQFILMSECCQNFKKDTDPLTPANLGSWGGASNYIQRVMTDIVGGAQGWTEWNLALDTFGHPNKDNKMADAPLLVDSAQKRYYKNPTFYALGQYSKFIAPDSVRIGVNASKTQRDFGSVAFERPDKSVSVIVYNTGSKPIQVVIKSDDKSDETVVNTIDVQTIQSYIYWN